MPVKIAKIRHNRQFNAVDGKRERALANFRVTIVLANKQQRRKLIAKARQSQEGKPNKTRNKSLINLFTKRAHIPAIQYKIIGYLVAILGILNPNLSKKCQCIHLYYDAVMKM